MFYCVQCANKRDWPISGFQSRGKCEMCGDVGNCSDVPSSYLSTITPKKQEAPAEPARLIRSSNGQMVHRVGCARAGAKTFPWLWAENKSRAEVKMAEVMGVKWCKVCNPLEAVPK